MSDVKELLLGYAVDYYARDADGDGNSDLYRMGRLPCPDASGTIGIEGNQDSHCGSRGVNSIGLLPFKRLGSGKIVDSSSECLWYVVSGDYKNQTSAELLNWDSVSYLNLVDENGNLKHSSSEDDFPIAFIVSPGITLGQVRQPDGALPDCHANHTVTDYLEGGPNIDYSSDLAADPDTVWEILSASEQSRLENSIFNDKLIAIYKSEWWGRVEQLGQLDTDDSSAVDTLAESVTEQLANCLVSYGNDSGNKTLPFAAPLELSDYRVSANYDDSDGLLSGRVPEKIDDSESYGNVVTDDDHFVSVECPSIGGNEVFWENWKDHFFYYLGKDFEPGTGTATNDRCDENKHCLTFDGHDKLAAVVFFAGPVKSGQTRIWTTSVDNKKERSNYLEGVNNFDYDGSEKTDFLHQDGDHNDYAFCVNYEDIGGGVYQFSTVKCRDLP